MTKNSNWKWAESSSNAIQLVGQFFNINPQSLKDVKDAEAKKILTQADQSDIQVKRTQDTINDYKKTWKNQARIGAMIHGLVRNGMDLVLQQRRHESQTTKQYAKLITNTSVLSAKTTTAVEKTYNKGAKQIEQTGKDLQRSNDELNEQYQVIDQTAEQQSQQRRIGYRERTQKRLAANQRPWRNY